MAVGGGRVRTTSTMTTLSAAERNRPPRGMNKAVGCGVRTRFRGQVHLPNTAVASSAHSHRTRRETGTQRTSMAAPSLAHSVQSELSNVTGRFLQPTLCDWILNEAPSTVQSFACRHQAAIIVVSCNTLPPRQVLADDLRPTISRQYRVWPRWTGPQGPFYKDFC